MCFAWKLLQAEFPLNKILISPRVDCVKLRFPVRFLSHRSPCILTVCSVFLRASYFFGLETVGATAMLYDFSHHPALFLAPCC